MQDPQSLSPTDAGASSPIARLMAGLPPEVVIIVLLLLVDGLTRLGHMGFLLYFAFFARQAGGFLQTDLLGQMWQPSLLIMAAEILIGVALLRRLPWARVGAILLAAALLWEGWYSTVGMAGVGTADLVPRAINVVFGIAAFAAAALLFVAVVYVLGRPHMRRALGETGVTDEEVPEKERAEYTSIIDFAVAIVSTLFTRLFGSGRVLAVVLIGVVLLRDGARMVINYLPGLLSLISAPPVAVTGPDPYPGLTAGDRLDILIAIGVGVLAALAGVALLRRLANAREWAGLLLIILCVQRLISLYIRAVNPAYGQAQAALTAVFVPQLLAAALAVAFYLYLRHMLQQAQAETNPTMPLPTAD